MFDYFFDEYKEDIYKNRRDKSKSQGDESIKNRISKDQIKKFLISFLIPGSVIVLYIWFKWKLPIINRVSFRVSLLLLFLWVLLVGRYANKKSKARREENQKRYEEKHINPLRDKLEEKGLYTDKKIEWLIDCCEKEHSEKKDDSTLLFTIISFIIGSVLVPSVLEVISNVGTLESIISLATILITTLTAIAGTVILMWPIVMLIVFPNKNVIDQLEKDLKYIRAQM